VQLHELPVKSSREEMEAMIEINEQSMMELDHGVTHPPSQVQGGSALLLHPALPAPRLHHVPRLRPRRRRQRRRHGRHGRRARRVAVAAGRRERENGQEGCQGGRRDQER
jgi:hypothetical protein